MSDWDAKMAILRRRFVERTLVERVSITRAGISDRETIEGIAHRINGSAGIFGLGELGLAADVLEQAIRDGCEDVELGVHVAKLLEAIECLHAL